MPDGGLSALYQQCPDVSDAGEAFEVDGGTWILPPPRGPHLACRLATCEDFASNVQAPPVGGLTLILTLAALVVGAGFGLWLGFDLFRR